MEARVASGYASAYAWARRRDLLLCKHQGECVPCATFDYSGWLKDWIGDMVANEAGGRPDEVYSC